MKKIGSSLFSRFPPLSSLSISNSLLNFTWQILCLPTSKKICQVKKSSSPIVWHNSLAKPRSNLHQESWEKQNFVYTLPPLENLHQKSFSILYFFHPPIYRETPMATTIRARIYTRQRWVLPSFYFRQVDLSNCWRPLFLILPKLDECQVSLPNCWSCSIPI
jgi:hypothetical protein